MQITASIDAKYRSKITAVKITAVIFFTFSLVCIFVASACSRSPRSRSADLQRLCADDLDLAGLAEKSLKRASKQFIVPKGLNGALGLKGSGASRFVSAVCAVYRDDPESRRSRLKALSQIYQVPDAGRQFFNPAESLWRQLTGNGYRGLISLSKNLSDFRASALGFGPGVMPGTWVSNPAPPLSVCELRFIFEKYLAAQRRLENKAELPGYEAELADYAGLHCTEQDRESVYLFRGDSGIVPTMYEARTMNLTQSGSIKNGPDYAKAPAQIRRNGTLAIARALFFYPPSIDEYMAKIENPVIFTESGLTEKIAPFYTLNGASAASDEELRKLFLNSKDQVPRGSSVTTDFIWDPKFQSASDLGLSETFKSQTIEGRRLEWQRLSVVLNRHIGYYSTKLISPSADFYTDRVSPWLSTTAYPHQSVKFTQKGYNREQEIEPGLHWLTVFRVKKKTLFSATDLIAGKNPDLTRDWLNEQSFSSDYRAARELAWDRLGSPSPDEIDSVLLLNRITPPAGLESSD